MYFQIVFFSYEINKWRYLLASTAKTSSSVTKYLPNHLPCFIHHKVRKPKKTSKRVHALAYKWSFVVLRPTCERPENYFCMKMLVFWCFWGEIEIFLVKSRQGVCKSRPKVEICNPWQDFTRKIEISPQSHQKSSIWMQKYVLWLSKVVCNTTENFVA